MDIKDSQVKKDLLEHKKHYDVEFRVGEKGDIIKAHKLILAQRSPVFEGMFFGPLAEKTSPIVIPDIEPATFEALLRYCYYDSLAMSIDQALPILYASKKYLLSTLEDACYKNLKHYLKPENIWKVLIYSLRYSDDRLLKRCHGFFNTYAVDVEAALRSQHFLDIPKEVLLHLLQFNDIESEVEGDNSRRYILISEIKLFQACDTWAGAECKRKGIEVSGPNKRKVLGDCLDLISFSNILIHDIVNVVFPTGILSQEEKYNILVNAHAAKNNGSEARTFSVDIYSAVFQPYESLQEYSPFQRRQIDYAAVEILPRQRLGFSGIDLLSGFSDDEMPAPALHEVTVIKNTKEKVICNFVMSKLLTGEPESHFLEFEEICLQAGAYYCIKVERTNETGVEGDIDVYESEDFYFSLAGACSFDIDVTNTINNNNISALRLRLL